jgi:hypothetical protein
MLAFILTLLTGLWLCMLGAMFFATGMSDSPEASREAERDIQWVFWVGLLALALMWTAWWRGW